MITLRDYQEAAVNAIPNALVDAKSTLVSACVGAGKTIIQAEFFKRTMQQASGARFISLAHTRELVDQNAKAMFRVWTGAPIGINSAALGRRDTRHPILFASIQSVAKHARKIGPVDVACVDEAHLIPANMDTNYGRFLSDLYEINPDMRLVGLSGTPFRLDSGWLHRGKNAMFDSMAYEIGIPDLIERGFLVPPVNRATATQFDVSGLKVRGGEYISGDLQERVRDGNTTDRAVAEMVEIGRAQRRKCWIVFCTGVEHAYQVRDAVRAHGITCETVEGNIEGRERTRLISAFKAGHIRCITNVNVLSVGFDHQGIDLLALMRPTKSVSLYIQQVGRGLRCLGKDIEESVMRGKKDVIVLDFAGLVRTLGPVDDPDVTTKDGSSDRTEPKPPPLKICAACMAYNNIAVRECADCGAAFQVLQGEDKIEPTASNLPVLSGRSSPLDWRPVDGVSFSVHRKFGASSETPPTMRVTYHCGSKAFSEYVCFQHPNGSFPHAKAARWWTSRGGSQPIPATVAEAVVRSESGDIGRVDAIRVTKDDGYDRIVAHRMASGLRDPIESLLEAQA